MSNNDENAFALRRPGPKTRWARSESHWTNFKTFSDMHTAGLN